MRCRSCCWLSSLLLWACAATAQPPGIDSIYLFTQFSGSVTQAIPLEGGDVILSGHRSIPHQAGEWQIMRMTPEREIVWRRTIPSMSHPRKEKLIIDGDWIVGVGRTSVRIDSNTFSSESVLIRYSIDGDSGWVRDYNDPVNYETLYSVTADGQGGYYVLGTKAMLSNETYNYQVWLFKVDSNGDMQWERFYGDEHSDQAGDIVRLVGDSLLFSMTTTLGANDHESFVWTTLEGDSLTSVAFESQGAAYASLGMYLVPRNGGWEHLWLNAINNVEDELHYLRTDYLGNVIFQQVVTAPQNAIQDFRQTPDGLLTAGYSPFGDIATRDVVIGRLSESGNWYYVEPIPLDLMQSASGFLPTIGGQIALLGNTQLDDTTYSACIFYLHDNEHDSFLFAIPSRVNFGVVPVGEVRLQEISLIVSGDSSVTISELLLPDFMTAQFPTPVTVLPGDTLIFETGFRADELRTYADTLTLTSDARNPVLGIPVSGRAPYPACEPALGVLNFFWIPVGDSVRRPFAVRNAGVTTLHIEPIVEPAPFYLDSLGPFDVAAGSEAVLWFTFRPDSAVDYRGELILQSDDPFGPDTVTLLGRGVTRPTDADDAAELPREFKLHSAYPNPFNAATTIRFDLPRESAVRLELFTVDGRLAGTLLDGVFAAGAHDETFDLHTLSSGIYFLALRAGSDHAVQKLLLVK
ncbi:MAG: T9SS type A sorting domain-containing protein [bacterium]|nr:T9SS type A sorting domain-containing protein [bacterium]